MSGEHILVIHQDEAERSLLEKKILRPAGYNVTATNLQDTIRGQQYHLVIMGGIGDEKSLQYAESLSEKYPAAPLILLYTSSGENGLLHRGYQAGATDCLIPPLRSGDLLDSVKRGLARRRRLENWAETYGLESVQNLKARINEMETISKVAQSVTSFLHLDNVLSSVVEAAVALTGAEEGSLLLVDDATRELYMRAAYNFQDEFARTFRLPTRDTLAGQVLADGKPVMLDRKTPEKIKTHYLVHSLIYVPLEIKGRRIGVLGVDNRQLKQTLFNEYDIAVMSALADFAAIAIENATLYSQTALEREKLETMMTRVGDGVILVDETCSILLMNHSAQQIFGVMADNFIGRRMGEVIDQPELVETVYDPTQTITQKVEIGLESGRFYIAQVSPVPGVGKTITIQDITHFKELDNIKNEFVHTVSHDLRSPLTAILGYVELIERVGEINAQQKDFIRRVQTSVQNITELINALLELGRIEAGFDQKKEPVPIPMIVQYAVDGLQHQFEQKGHEVIVDMHDHLPPVFGNPVRLRQMINNLLENAIKYTPDGGQVFVRARAEGDQIILQIQDTGVGIPPADQPYIFDKLYRASNVPMDSKGTGLGLAIVKSIVENHEGRLWFDSNLGRGTTFTVVLPALAEVGG
jgi:two-component system NtrC family sensor kinase